MQASFAAYEDLASYLAAHGLELGWKYYRDGGAWLCRIVKGKKTLAWLSAWNGYFMTTVYVASKLAEELERVPLAPEALRAMLSAGEGRKHIPCTFTIRTPNDLLGLYAVVEFKLERA